MELYFVNGCSEEIVIILEDDSIWRYTAYFAGTVWHDELQEEYIEKREISVSDYLYDADEPRYYKKETLDPGGCRAEALRDALHSLMKGGKKTYPYDSLNEVYPSRLESNILNILD